MSSSKESNRVCFKIDKQLNYEDLELVILYLENTKKSNGGDVKSHNLDESRRVLVVEFESVDAKHRVLSKKVHKCLDYALIAYNNDDFSCKNDVNKLNKKYLIVKNIRPDEDISVISLYVEYLVIDNDICEIKQMKFVDTAFLIRFNDDIDIESVRKRLQKRPTLRSQEIFLFECYDQCIYLAKTSDLTSIFDHIFNKLDKLDDTDGHIQLAKVTNETYAINNVAFLHELTDLMTIERVFNTDLIKELSISKVEMNKPVKNADLNHSIVLDCSIPLCLVLINSKYIFNEFSEKLLKLYKTIEVKILNQEIHILSGQTQVAHDEWHTCVCNVIEEFERQVHFAQVHIYDVKNQLNKIENDIKSLNEKNQNLYLYIKDDYLCITGYETEVQQAYNMFSAKLDPKNSELNVKKSASTSSINAIESNNGLQNASFLYIFKSNTLFTQAIKDCPQIALDLNQRIKSKNGQLKLNSDKNLVIVPIEDYAEVKQDDVYKWLSNIDSKVNDLCSKQMFTKTVNFNVNFEKKQIDFALRRLRNENKLNISFEINTNSVCFFGYKNSISKIIQLISSYCVIDGDMEPEKSKLKVEYECVPLPKQQVVVTGNAMASASASGNSRSPFTLPPVPPPKLSNTPVPVQNERKSSSSSSIKENFFDDKYKVCVDEMLTKLLLSSDAIFKQVNKAVCGNNAHLVKQYAPDTASQTINIYRVNKGSLNPDEWCSKVKKLLKVYVSNNLKSEKYSLINEIVLSELDALFKKYKSQFVYEIDKKESVIKLIGMKETIKKVVNVLNAKMNNKPTSAAKASSSARQTPTPTSIEFTQFKKPTSSSVNSTASSLRPTPATTPVPAQLIASQPTSRKSSISSVMSSQMNDNKQFYKIKSSFIADIIDTKSPSQQPFTLLLNDKCVFTNTLSNCSRITGQLNEHLLAKSNAMAFIDNGKACIMRLVSNTQTEIDWTNNVLKELECYVNKNINYRKIKVTKPQTIDELKNAQIDSKLVYYQTENARVLFCGLRSEIDRIAEWFADKQDESELEINIKTEPKLEIFTYFDIYLKQLTQKLSALGCTCTFDVNKPEKLLFKTENNNNNDWKKSVRQLMSEYLSEFKISTVKIEENLLFNYDTKSIHVNKISENKIQVFGMSTEVDRLIEQITIRRSKDVASTNNANKFQLVEDSIENLNIDQTKSLFQKDYFGYISENYNQLTVLFDKKNKGLYFKGSASDISSAKLHAFKIFKGEI